MPDFGGGGSPASEGAALYSQQTGNAINELKNMYERTRTDLAPYRDLGEKTVPYYAGILNIPGYDRVDPTQALMATPGYQWQVDQGVKALDRSAAAKGLLGSGAQRKGLLSFGQNAALANYENYMNRLYGTMGTGQNAAAQTGQFGMQSANSIANLYQGLGQAQQQALYDDYNARQSAFGGTLNTLMGLGNLGLQAYGLSKWSGK